MNEIEKMYEKAGFQKKRKCEWDKDKESCFHSGFVTCDKCTAKIERTYSPFTAEKQIAILQLLTQQCDLTISHFTEWEFIHFDGQEPIQVTGKDFTETFAKLVNEYWQDLTEEEKASIKNILEM